MIKPSVKPPTDPSDAMKYQSVQTIAYQPKDVNIIFCPLFVQMRERLVAVMQKKYIFYTGLSPDELEETVNRYYTAEYLAAFDSIENDISKYDKSMTAYCLLFECTLYLKLGLPMWLVHIWYISHVRSVYVDRTSGFSTKVDFQRRSGDPSTFFGNTLINLAVTVAIYPADSIVLLLLAGDDHLIFGRGLNYTTSGLFADLFNFEAKTLPQYKFPYFCGKFLIFVGNNIYFVPDPIRTITKIGRRDLRNEDHIEQYRVSLKDVLAPLNNVLIFPDLSAAITERYKTERSDHLAVIHSILYLISTSETFKELYYTFPGQNISFDPSLPSLEI
uniref:Putative RNA-dependent RNA-polymerase n=1 Tax=Bombus-associated virus Vir1 TaxID=2511064 RepID=A0A411D3D1_9VIRU|nr:putative RNA-dependent RNA-polymerase [Bombus-associated virus Vir1]